MKNLPKDYRIIKNIPGGTLEKNLPNMVVGRLNN